MKIGIFGGSFNPIHRMHERIGNELINKHYVDKIIIVPTGDHYSYKNNLANGIDRFNMIKLVCDKYENFSASDYELKDYVVYTYDTLSYFHDLYPEDEIYFICGVDNLSYVDKWKNGLILLRNYKFLVINRNTNNLEELLNKYKEYCSNIIVVPMDMDNISSTYIRNGIKDDKDVSSSLDEDVYKYIKKKKLYKEGV